MINVDAKLTPNFKLSEFLHEGSKDGLAVDILANLIKTAGMLENIRKRCGDKPIIITSGFRTLEHNREVGGAMPDPNKPFEPGNGSYHLYGMAADFVVDGLTPHQVQEILADWNGGLELAPTWTHADWGPKRRFYIS